jgi:AcrR family transcriptional regulator
MKKDEKGRRAKDRIYLEAFKQFITRPYALVTFRELERATGMTRGGIFHYVRDKEQLFKEVIDEYFFNNQSIFERLGTDICDENISLRQFIDVLVQGIDTGINTLYKLLDFDAEHADKKRKAEIERAYIALIASAGNYMDSFNPKMCELLDNYRDTTSYFFRQAINRGEIKPGIDANMYGEIFTCLYPGSIFNGAMSEGIDLEKLKNMYLAVYESVKA